MPGRKRQYLQVLLAYYRRPAFRILALSACATMALFLRYVSAKTGGFETPYADSLAAQLLMLLGFLVVFSPVVLLITFTAILMWHVREQLQPAGSHLIPGFRNANLNVAGAIFLCVPLLACSACWGIDHLMLMQQLHRAVYGTVPYGMYFRMMQSDTTFALGVFAVALTLMSLTAIWASFRSPWLSLLMIPLFLLAITWQPLATFIDHLLSPPPWDVSNRVHAVEIVGANIMLFFAVRIKLSQPQEAGPLKRIRAFEAKRDRGDDRLPPHRLLTAPFTRIWHRRHGVLNPVAPWAVAGIIGLLLVCVPFVLGAKQSDMLRSLLLPTLVPGVVISALWRERWLNLGYESLYPVERSRFIGELAAATAINLAELWLATTLAVLPAIAIWQPRMFASQMLYVTLAASAAMQFMVFGVMFVTALFRPLLPYMNIVTILAMLIPIAFTWASEPSLSPHGLLLVAAIEMAIGLILTAWGSAAWRRTDLA